MTENHIAASGAAAGSPEINEEMIHALVHGFYGRVRRDPALAPIFNREIGDGWDRHLAKMCDFWSAVMLGTGRFKGAPMATHARLPQIRATHFAKWLYLFELTAREVCPPDAAELFVRRAHLIGQSLQQAIAEARPGGAAPA